VIAEMSGNHNGMLERALTIVDHAARAGVHALKLQTYTAETITLDSKGAEFTIQDPSSLWDGRTLHSLYDEAHTPWEWHEAIFARCHQLDIACFSSPFDETAVDFLEDLGAPAYKIASFENVHLPLIRKAASTGKPLIMSTGMATETELAEAVEAARDSGCTDLILLKCTSAYPAEATGTNLLTIPAMRSRFGCQVGLSDHTIGSGVSLAAVALGATVIERHFTISRADGGVDSAFSMEPEEMCRLVEESERAWLALGTVHYGPTGQEEASIRFRRSIYVAEDVRAGDVLDNVNLRVVRPGLGLPPKHYDELLGKRINRDVPKGTPLSWDLVDQ
jgi:N-acetylneuraminate synthase